ncbi:MAG: plasmid stabilization protein [Acetobacteraceae bacterium]
MAQLLVRDLDDHLIRAIEQRAISHGRSVEAEHRAILEAALVSEQESFFERAARLRARTPPSTFDSAEQIRFDRDHNYDYDADEL